MNEGIEESAQLWAALAFAGAAFLLLTACFPTQGVQQPTLRLPPPPPALRRPLLGAGVLAPGRVGVVVAGGHNAVATARRLNTGPQYNGETGWEAYGAEAAVRGRVGLGAGVEINPYVATPDLIGGAEGRWQFLGRPGKPGGIGTLELGANGVADLYGGLAVGARAGAFEPWGEARAGWWAPGAVPYWEAGGGLAWRPWSLLGFIAGWSTRVDARNGAVLADGPNLGVDLRFGGRRRAAQERRP